MAGALIWIAATLPFLAVAGCAGAASEDPGSAGQAASRMAPRCFSSSRISSFRAADANLVHIRVGRDVYRLDMMGPCRDLNWTGRMRLVTSGSSTVCTGPGIGTSIVSRTSTGQQRCQVQRITALSAEEVAALPANQRP